MLCMQRMLSDVFAEAEMRRAGAKKEHHGVVWQTPDICFHYDDVVAWPCCVLHICHIIPLPCVSKMG